MSPELEARPVARKLARSVSGMPYREAVFLINRALDFIDYTLYAVERDSDFHDGAGVLVDVRAAIIEDARQVLKEAGL